MDAESYWSLLDLCTNLREQDAIMNAAADDPEVSHTDFIQMCLFCQQRVQHEKWL